MDLSEDAPMAPDKEGIAAVPDKGSPIAPVLTTIGTGLVTWNVNYGFKDGWTTSLLVCTALGLVLVGLALSIPSWIRRRDPEECEPKPKRWLRAKKFALKFALFALVGGCLSSAVAWYCSQQQHTVVIGDQEWMAENLNVDRFINGDLIPEAKSPEEWAKLAAAKSPAWCYYGNKPANGQKYGRLYNWYAVDDSRGLAPSGFHIPTKLEWNRLLASSGGEGGPAYSTLTATGPSKFNALLGGSRHDEGMFLLQESTGYWSSTEGYPGIGAAFHLIIDHSGKSAKLIYYKGGLGLSVRCLKGHEPRTEPESQSMTAADGGSVAPPAIDKGSSQALIDAIKAQDSEKVRSLLASGAAPNSIENEYGVSPLEFAVARGQIDTIMLLLANGVDVDTRSKKGATALDMAIEAVNPYIAKILIDKGADVNRASAAGITPIEHLSGVSSKGPAHDQRVVELMEYLVEKGANIRHDSYKGYYFALLNGNQSAVEFFLKNGVNVNMRSSYGVSGLMVAASKGHADIVKFLLTKGADKSFVDNDNKTALGYALESHDQATIATLKHGSGRAQPGNGSSPARP